MQFAISHTTTYHYANAVSLGAHVIRLRPRADGKLLLLDYRCAIEPKPCASGYYLDHEGNSFLRARFDIPTRQLEITSRFTANTFGDDNNDLAEPSSLPVVYNSDERLHLAPYCQPSVLEPDVQRLLGEMVVVCERRP